MMPINKNMEQEHQLTYIKHEEGKRNILFGRKRGNMRNKRVKKLKNFIQQKKYDTSIKTLIVDERSSNLTVYCARINTEI
jgi:hypothetical protein